MKSKPRVTICSFVAAHPAANSLHLGIARKRLVEINDLVSVRKLDYAKQLSETSELDAIVDLGSESLPKTQIA